MKKTVTILSTLLLSVSLFAGLRSPESAAELAATALWGAGLTRRAPVRAEAMKLAYTAPRQGAQIPAFYAFNHPDGGFAVISADDCTEAVLCYSETGRIDTARMNPSFRWWLSRFQEEISTLGDEEPYEAPAHTTVEAIEPLLGNITWYQGVPYNNLCPIDIYDNTRCATGCVATAAAQIMLSWHYPVKGSGTKTYTWYNYDPSSYSYWGGYTNVLQTLDLTADYENTYYEWENMLPSYAVASYTAAQGEAVATLMYQCGVACEMEYGGDAMGGSGAMIDDMGNGMVEHFGYTYSSYMDQYSGYVTTNQMQTAFNSDLEAGRPILMGGYDNSAGGHAFVCDGRDASGKFHINWGWEGECNCYTSLTVMRPDGENYRFNNYMSAIIGLEPAWHPSAPTGDHYATCREANTAPVGDTMYMNPVIVVYAKDSYVYLSDNTGCALLNDSHYGLKAGDEVSGLVAMSVPDNNVPLMRGMCATADLTVGEGTIPDPVRQTKAPTEELLNQYVRIENLAIEGRFSSITRTKLPAIMPDNTELVLYNQFRVPCAFSSDKRYTVDGFVGRNNDEIRIYPIAFHETEVSGIAETTATTAPRTVKVIENGRIYILRDGVRYSVLGNQMD